MADQAGLLVLDEERHIRISIDTCWVDRRVRCPYGQPEGQFILRPEKFCDKSCMHFPRYAVVSPDDVEVLQTDAILDHFKENNVSVNFELEEQAKAFPNDSVKRLALLLAADLIKGERLDKKILLEDDLPEKVG